MVGVDELGETIEFLGQHFDLGLSQRAFEVAAAGGRNQGAGKSRMHGGGSDGRDFGGPTDGLEPKIEIVEHGIELRCTRQYEEVLELLAGFPNGGATIEGWDFVEPGQRDILTLSRNGDDPARSGFFNEVQAKVESFAAVFAGDDGVVLILLKRMGERIAKIDPVGSAGGEGGGQEEGEEATENPAERGIRVHDDSSKGSTTEDGRRFKGFREGGDEVPNSGEVIEGEGWHRWHRDYAGRGAGRALPRRASSGIHYQSRDEVLACPHPRVRRPPH